MLIVTLFEEELGSKVLQIVLENFAPRDRELKNESKQLGLLSFSHKQDVCACNQNLPNSDAVKITES